MTGITFKTVQKDQPKNDTVIIVGGGRSLTDFDFNRLRNLGYIIAVNDSGKIVTFADAWFTLDPWGLNGPQLPPTSFRGLLYAAVPDDFGTPKAYYDNHRVAMTNMRIRYLHRLVPANSISVSSSDRYRAGLSEDDGCINTGNSGYGALNLAYHLRPKRVLLLGIDGDIGYYYTKTTQNRRLTNLPEMFASAKPQLEKNGIEVINGSINSAVTAFPRMSIDDALRVLGE